MAINTSNKSKFFPKIFFPECLQICFQVSALFLLATTTFASSDARAEAFSINDAISQAVHTNPGVGEAAANRRGTETKLYQTQGGELKVIVPELVVGAAGLEPADSPDPREARRPASNTCVCPGVSLGGTTMLPGAESPITIVRVACDNEPSASLMV